MRVLGVLAPLVCLAFAGRALAQVDPSGSWRTLHTPHFRIHFRPAYRDVAQEEAREGERAYRLLSSELHAPRGAVDITLGDDIDAANGFTSVFPSNRITIFLTPPATDPGLQRYDSWLRLVTVHELTHVFHLDRARRFWGVLQDVFGRAPGLFPNEYQPSWVTEGLATYYESKFTNGGRVRGSLHTQVLAADQAAGASRSPWDALLFTRWADGLVPYAYGSRFFHYLAGEAGDSVLPRFVEATAGQAIPYRVGRQLGRAAPGRTLVGEWPRGTRPATAPSVGPSGEILDRGLWTEPVPRVSPDGRRVAYLRDDGKGARLLRVVDVGDHHTVREHRVNGAVSYDWVGDTLVVAQLDFVDRWRVRSDLYRWLPGGRWARETHAARLTEPRAGGGRLSSIALGPARDYPTLPAPSEAEAGATWGDVVPSPDGRWIAATRNAGGHWALVRWPANAPDSAAILRAARGVLADPAWTPDGALLYVSDDSGFPQVYRWSDAAGPGGGAVTAEPLGARAPAALPDESLLYATLSAYGWELKHAAAARTATPGPFPEPLPFDPAPAVPTRETGYTAGPSLRPHFWIPLFVDAGAAGRFGGAATAGSDAVGRYSYLTWALLSPAPLRGAGSFAAVSHLLGNPTLDFNVSADWSLTGTTAGGTVVSERDQDAALGASFVTRRWRTVASLRLAGEFEGTRFVAVPDTMLSAICTGCDSRDLIGASATLGLAHFVSAPLAISPEDGFAWSVTFRRREEQGSSRWSNEIRSRLGLYARLPALGGFAHHVLAVRLAAGATGGPIGKLLKVGGVSSGTFDLGFGQSFGDTRTFPVRGYAAGELRGRRAATATIEYRLPLALLGRSLGRLPFGADKLSVSLFGDVGGAWDGAPARLTRLRSAGLEVVGDMTFNYDFPTRLRFGVAAPLVDPPSGRPRRLQAYVAFASDF